jgi:hypothetical protein
MISHALQERVISWHKDIGSSVWFAAVMCGVPYRGDMERGKD